MKGVDQDAFSENEPQEDIVAKIKVPASAAGKGYGFVSLAPSQVSTHPGVFRNISTQNLELLPRALAQGGLFIHSSIIKTANGETFTLQNDAEVVIEEIAYDKDRNRFYISRASTLRKIEENRKQQRKEDNDWNELLILQREIRPQLDELKTKINTILNIMYGSEDRFEWPSQRLCIDECTVSYPPTKSLVIVQSHYSSDNSEEPSSKYYRSYENYHVWLAYIGGSASTLTPDDLYRLTEPDKLRTVRVTLRASVEVDKDSQLIAKAYREGSETSFRINSVIDSENVKSAITSPIYVNEEQANEIWEFSHWWKVPREGLGKAYTYAQNIFAAKTAWEENFPGVRFGDIETLLRQIHVDPNNLRQYYIENKAQLNDRYKYVPVNFPEMSTLTGYKNDPFIIDIPPIFHRPLEELMTERFKKLNEAVLAGDPDATELMEEENYINIRKDLFEGFTSSTGYVFNESAVGSGPGQTQFWDTERRDKSSDKANIPEWEAYTLDTDGNEIVVANAEVYNRDYQYFLRINCSKDRLNIPQIYYPGSLKWRKKEKH